MHSNHFEFSISLLSSKVFDGSFRLTDSQINEIDKLSALVPVKGRADAVIIFNVSAEH